MCKRFIIGIGLQSYGGLEVPQSAVCKLENQESQWYNSVWAQRPRAGWPLVSKGPGTRSFNTWGQEGMDVQLKQRERIPPTRLFVLFGPWMNWMMPAHISEGRSSLHSLLIQMLISSRNTLTDIPRNCILLASRASLSLAKWTHKINHHRWQN